MPYPTPPAAGPRPSLHDALAECIETEAAAFADKAQFRAAAARLVESLESSELEEIGRDIAFTELARFLRQLSNLRDPAQNLDALTVLCSSRADVTEFARKHGVTRQAFNRRVVRLGRYLGVPYRRRRTPKRIKAGQQFPPT